MGFLFTKGATKQDIINECTRDFNNDLCRVTTIKQRCIGKNLWTVHEVTVKQDYDNHKAGDVYRFIGLCMIESQRGFGYGYNSFSENMGPYKSNCPLEFLALADEKPYALSEDAKAFRARVRAYHAVQAQIKRLKPDDVVVVYGKEYQFTCFSRTHKASILATRDGREYRVRYAQIEAVKVTDERDREFQAIQHVLNETITPMEKEMLEEAGLTPTPYVNWDSSPGVY